MWKHKIFVTQKAFKQVTSRYVRLSISVPMCVETAWVLIIINTTLSSGCLTVTDNGELGLTREVGLTSLADLDWCPYY